MTLLAYGIGGVVIAWLIFSVVKKIFGFLFLGALVVGGYVLWTNPAMLESLTQTVMGMVGGR